MIYRVIDVESFSRLNIKDCGSWRYNQDESTENICFGWATVNLEQQTISEPEIWIPEEHSNLEIFDEFEYEAWVGGCPDFVLNDDGKQMFVAHNVEMEISHWKYVLTPKYDWPECPALDRWVDTAAIARYFGYPGGLKNAGLAMGLDHIKDDEGHKKMLKVSKPRKPSKHNPDTRWYPTTSPQDFLDTYYYNMDDCLSEAAILLKCCTLPGNAQRDYLRNLEMNMRGWHSDVKLSRTIIDLKNHHCTYANKRIAQLTKSPEHPEGKITATTQRQRIVDYLGIENTQREYLEEIVKKVTDKKKKEIINLCLSTGRSAVSKFERVVESTCIDGTMKGLQIYHGAHTGRYTSEDLQAHNLFRPVYKEDDLAKAITILLTTGWTMDKKYKEIKKEFKELMALFSSLVRSAFKAPRGYTFGIVDFSAVEARMLAWMVGVQEQIAIFGDRTKDIYCEFASYIYGRKITDKDERERFVGKQAVLGLGYGMGPDRFVGQCASFGVEIAFALADKIVKLYRSRYPQIKKFWSDLENAFIDCVKYKRRIKFSKFTLDYVTKPFNAVRVRLPSGRYIRYTEPELKDTRTPWGDIKDAFCFKVWKKGQWRLHKTWGGELTENLDQAMCADLLNYCWEKIKRNGIDVVMTVHDEIISLLPTKQAKTLYNMMLEMMRTPAPWCEGLPIWAAGSMSKRFKK